MNLLLTTKEAAEHVGVSQSTILNWIKKGYLGDCTSQSVTRGSGCGYKIRQSDLDAYVHGWTFEKSEPKPKKTDTLIKVEDLRIDKKSIRTAAANLRIAIEFAQEELTKIEALL